MLKGYRYHIVISYAHTGEVCEWVHNHFLPVLNFRLGSILDEEPQIFIDKEIEVSVGLT